MAYTNPQFLNWNGIKYYLGKVIRTEHRKYRIELSANFRGKLENPIDKMYHETESQAITKLVEEVNNFLKKEAELNKQNPLPNIK